MKYFTYNQENIFNNLSGYNKALGDCCDSITEIDTAEPITLSPNTIRFLVAKLKEEKNSFKNLVYKFNSLKPHEVLTLMKKFYIFSSGELRKFQLKAYEEIYPTKKTIKTSMFNTTLSKTPWGCGYHQVKATVLARKGVKLRTLKTYSKEELSKMIANDDIVIIAKEEYGRLKAYANQDNFLQIETLAREFDFKTFNEDEINTINRKNPEALEELLGSISVSDLQFNYESDYLPAYKKMLDYLVKCAKVTVAQNEANKKDLQKQINKANEQNRELEDVKKLIIDTSKGR